MAFRRIGTGELAAVTKLCAAIGPDASVVILDSLTADRFAQLVRGMCDTPTAIADEGHPGHGQRRGRRHREGAAGAPSCWPRTQPNSALRRHAPRGRQPADHPGGAQPDLAARPAPGSSTTRSGCPARRHQPRGLASSPVVSTFPAEPEHVARPCTRAFASSTSIAACTSRHPHVSSCCPASTRKSTCCSRSSGSARRWTRAASAYELLAIDDGSTDQTLARLRRAEPDFPSLKVIHFPPQRRRGHRAPDRHPAGPGRHRGLDRRRPDLPERAYPRVRRHARRRPDDRPGGGRAHQRGRHAEDRPGARPNGSSASSPNGSPTPTSPT